MKKKNCVIWIQTVSLYTRKTHVIYKDTAEDVETRFNISNYELERNSTDRPLPKGKNKKVIGLKKDE